MPVGVAELLKSAKKFSDSADCEADFRATVARSYYAVHGECVKFHTSLPSPGSQGTQTGGMHAILAACLKNPTVTDDGLKKNSKRLGYLLSDLHARRIVADYQLEAAVSSQEALKAYSDSELIFEILGGHVAAELPPRFVSTGAPAVTELQPQPVAAPRSTAVTESPAGTRPPKKPGGNWLRRIK